MAVASVRLVLTALLIVATPADAQQLGTKIMGGLGIDAGTQGPPGLFVLDRFIQFGASTLRDNTGDRLPVAGLDVLVRANALGLACTLATHRGPRLTFAAGVPYARVALNSEEPQASVDRLGVGDIYVLPIKVGWRNVRHDVVASYAFFAPTGKFEPKTGIGVGRGQWTHQFSIGGGLFADSLRSKRASALLSYELNGRKRGIDITRGDLLQLHGGAGISISKLAVVGVAAYALWQVRDDRGADLPPALAGSRTRTYGLGPEIDVTIPKLGLRVESRIEWDIATRARPQGYVFAFAASYRALAPPK